MRMMIAEKISRFLNRYDALFLGEDHSGVEADFSSRKMRRDVLQGPGMHFFESGDLKRHFLFEGFHLGLVEQLIELAISMHEEIDAVGSGNFDDAMDLFAEEFTALTVGHGMNTTDGADGWNENIAIPIDTRLVLTERRIETVIIAGQNGMLARRGIFIALIHVLLPLFSLELLVDW